MGDLTKNFSAWEFKCECCDSADNLMDPEFIDQLQQARDFSALAFRISSGYRCDRRNAEVGGKEDSLHLAGRAADIVTGTSHAAYVIHDCLKKACFTRFKLYSGHIHVDMGDASRPDNVLIWGER